MTAKKETPMPSVESMGEDIDKHGARIEKLSKTICDLTVALESMGGSMALKLKDEEWKTENNVVFTSLKGFQILLQTADDPDSEEPTEYAEESFFVLEPDEGHEIYSHKTMTACFYEIQMLEKGNEDSK